MSQADQGAQVEAFLAGRARVVDAGLDRLLPPADVPPARLHEAMRYSVFAGGKRLRPALTLVACSVAGGEDADALGAACAIELLHTYSLIHDDLPAMDDDDLRRGKPSCHKAYGEAMAVLAGDALHTLAFELIARETPRQGAVAPLVRELARAVGTAGMVGGQVLDIAAASSGEPLSVSLVESIHRSKTAALIAACLRCGVLATRGGEPDPENDPALAILGEFGQTIGVAFQIADDILDVTGTEETLGKSIGKDRSQEKATYPAVAGMEASRRRARELADHAVALLGRLEETNGRKDAIGFLRGLAHYIVERKH